MKETTRRAPDEGELWSNKLNSPSEEWFVVRLGKLYYIRMHKLSSAITPSALALALSSFDSESTHARTRNIEGVADGCEGWALKADSYKEEIELVVLEKLNGWQEGLQQASYALAKFMS